MLTRITATWRRGCSASVELGCHCLLALWESRGEVCLGGLRYVAARRVGCYMCRDGGFARSSELHTRYYCAVALGAEEKGKKKNSRPPSRGLYGRQPPGGCLLTGCITWSDAETPEQCSIVCVAWRKESVCYTPDFSLGCILLVCCLGGSHARGMLILSVAAAFQAMRAMACGVSKGWWGGQMQARQGTAGMLDGPVCYSAECPFMQEHVSV